MSTIEVLLLALSMAIDSFVVCLAAGALPDVQGLRPTFRLAFHFGLFQFLMPIIGWLAGTTIEPYIRDVDHWVAFGLAAFVGGRMLYSGWRHEGRLLAGPSRGWALGLLSIAGGLD